MAVPDVSVLQRLQGLVLLMSCLPPAGACRQILQSALDLDPDGPLRRLTPPGDHNSPHHFQLWLESQWGQVDLSPEEQEVVWWLLEGDNMEVAIRELNVVEARVKGQSFLV